MGLYRVIWLGLLSIEVFITFAISGTVAGNENDFNCYICGITLDRS